MMEAVHTSETSVDNHFTRQYNPEDSSEQNTYRLQTSSQPRFTQLIIQGILLMPYNLHI
jgi:hypothetical protein